MRAATATSGETAAGRHFRDPSARALQSLCHAITDALRWWFVRDVGAVADTDFTIERLIARANEDLANGLGNVTNRVVTLIYRYREGLLPQVTAEPLDAARDLDGHVRRALVDFDLRRAAQLISDAVTALNRDLEISQPWVIAKAEAVGRPAAGRELDVLLVRHLLTARAIASAATPIVPGLAARLLDQLGNDQRVSQPRPAFCESTVLTDTSVHSATAVRECEARFSTGDQGHADGPERLVDRGHSSPMQRNRPGMF